MRLYYYTAKQWAMKSLWEKRLKIADYADLNDPFEFLPFKQTLHDDLISKILARSHGVLCFSDRWATALMWAHYGDKHHGLVLGFDVQEGEWLSKIRYAPKRLESDLDFTGNLGAEHEEYLRTCLNVKHAAWKYEREYRLRSETNERVDGIAYSKFGMFMDLREVIIGARSKLTARDVADSVGQPETDVLIRKASPARQSFAHD
jgi:Protein of unknown function (DUF2971)